MWINPDAARQYHSPYSYTPNPVSETDPDGNYVGGAPIRFEDVVVPQACQGCDYRLSVADESGSDGWFFRGGTQGLEYGAKFPASFAPKSFGGAALSVFGRVNRSGPSQQMSLEYSSPALKFGLLEAKYVLRINDSQGAYRNSLDLGFAFDELKINFSFMGPNQPLTNNPELMDAVNEAWRFVETPQ